MSAKSLKLFYCYARENKAWRDKLDRHLSGLKREYQITSWSDGEITPGAEWQQEIDVQLNTANGRIYAKKSLRCCRRRRH